MTKRKLRFRAWNKATRKMIDLYKVTPLVLNTECDGIFIPFREECEIMQFTGLFDKNGKAIYEGDIVQWVSTFIGAEKNLHTDEVKWVESAAGFLLMSWIHELDAADMTIIGNIHENPELLEG